MLLFIFTITVAASLVSAQDDTLREAVPIDETEVVEPILISANEIGEPRTFFGSQDMVDVSQDSLAGNRERLDPITNEGNRRHIQKIHADVLTANEFVESGNNISSLEKEFSKRNETLNRNYLLAERFWKPPHFDVISARMESVPNITGSFTFPEYPCNSWKYYCPVQWRILWGFRHGRRNCYIPWPAFQLVRYAKCICPFCLAPFRFGTCEESFYERRNFLAVCLTQRRKLSNAVWLYLTRLVPTGCRCRTC